jgi:hypothetical protein
MYALVEELARGCQENSGNLELQSVTSLAVLGSLRRVEGALRIEHTERLYTLAGLEQLRSVEALELNHNARLINASALRGLAVALHARVTDNPRLSRRYGWFDGLTRSGVKIELLRNRGLTVEGFADSSPATLAVR